MRRLLLETGFLLALNPRDPNHGWATELLEGADNRRIEIVVSPVAFIELSLILRSRGVDDGEVARAMESFSLVLEGRATVGRLDEEVSALAARLRATYEELTFFDSLHAALTLSEGLEYGDLDEVVRSVVERERSGRSHEPRASL